MDGLCKAAAPARLCDLICSSDSRAAQEACIHPTLPSRGLVHCRPISIREPRG